MQHKINKTHKLLDENGKIIEAGYATSLLLDYSRDDIKASKLKIKEWDYYLIKNQKYAVALTIADNGYMGLGSVTFLDFENKTEITKSVPSILSLGKLKAPTTSKKGNWNFKSKTIDMVFKNNGKSRLLSCKFKNFVDKKDFECSFVLFDNPKNTMVIVTPFYEKENKFYYNQKINCMSVDGYIKIGDDTYKFGNDSMATLDWGRGVWSYNNTWHWGSLSTRLDNGATFGFNVGYGFGNTEAASENMLFYNGIAHKLDKVTFNIPNDGKSKEDFIKPWTFTSNDGRFEFDFKPILDRSANLNIGVMCSIQHQVFGKFTGKAILDDGTVIELKDEIGFAEKVHNKW